MDWNHCVDGLNIWEPIYGDFVMSQFDDISSTSFHTMAVVPNDHDLDEPFSQCSTSSSFQDSAFYIPAQSQQAHPSIEISSSARRLFTAPQKPHNDDLSELSTGDTLVQQVSNPQRRPICDPCGCKTFFLKIPSLEEAGSRIFLSSVNQVLQSHTDSLDGSTPILKLSSYFLSREWHQFFPSMLQSLDLLASFF